MKARLRFAYLAALTAVAGCSYQDVGGPLRPGPSQAPAMSVADDGSITFTRDRLEVTLRPMTDEELDRQTGSESGVATYTYGDVEFADGIARSRFTVFALRVKNYTYPKVVIDPSQVEVVAENGRRYWSLSQAQLEAYFRAYVLGYQGNTYSEYRERMGTLNRTLYAADPVFSGQERDGFVVFPVLHDDVAAIEVVVHGARLRFDFRGEPVETVDIRYHLERPLRPKSWRDTPMRAAAGG
jgi:hypothetical protein